MEKDGAIEAVNVEAWRNWLAQNGEHSSNVWLIIYHKNSGIPSIYYDEAVDEALCWGWVDSKVNKRDHQSYFQFFARRNPKSNWSRVNKEKIQRLLDQGRMHPAGLEMVRIAKETGTWAALDDVENLVIPPDLMAEFSKRPPALENWNNFPRSVKRGVLEWILNAKRPATREKRLLETAELSQLNIRPLQWGN